MSIVLVGSTSGSCTLQEQAVAGTTVLTLPTTSGTVLTSASSVTRSQLPVGSILQVVSTTSDAAQSINTQSFTEITGLTTSITPSSSSNRILIIAEVRFCGLVNATETLAHFRLRRDSTDICQGAGATGNMVNVTASASEVDQDTLSANITFNFLDSPSTTSSVSYKIMGATYANGMQINRPSSPDNQFYNGFVTSTMTLLEVAHA